MPREGVSELKCHHRGKKSLPPAAPHLNEEEYPEEEEGLIEIMVSQHGARGPGSVTFRWIVVGIPTFN